jgi:ABC-type protease/lipase transport system fused ATPase/permease subunit
MHGTGRAVVLHPALARTPWPVAAAVAAAEVAKHLALTLAVVAGGTFVVAAALVVGVVAAPVLVALAAWLLWRASRDGARGVKRSLASARRRARALGLRVVEGAART